MSEGGPAPRGYFDLGGLPAGPVDRRERELVFWEKQMAAMRVLLDRDHVGLEELRDAFETFGEGLYRTLGFFERMYEATVRVLGRKGVIALDAIEARVTVLEREYGRRAPLLPDGDLAPDPYGGRYRYRVVAGPDAPPSLYELRCHALRDELVARGVLAADAIRAAIERIEAPGLHLGARIVARAWTDEAFRTRILADGMAACAEYGITFVDGRLTIIANTPDVHNVVVCTLCSCYPRNLLGQPPAWYVGKAYRARTVREPRAVLAEMGTLLPRHVSIRVHDSTADLRYMILPLRPAGTTGWDAARLERLVTRDSLIGVAAARRPGH
jgi:nitrile hydratase